MNFAAEKCHKRDTSLQKDVEPDKKQKEPDGQESVFGQGPKDEAESLLVDNCLFVKKTKNNNKAHDSVFIISIHKCCAQRYKISQANEDS